MNRLVKMCDDCHKCIVLETVLENLNFKRLLSRHGYIENFQIHQMSWKRQELACKIGTFATHFMFFQYFVLPPVAC